MYSDAEIMDKVDLDDLPLQVKEIAEVIGIENTKKLISVLGGSSYYVPKVSTFRTIVFAKDMQADKSLIHRHSYRKLGKMYGISDATIYNTISNTKGGRRSTHVCNQLFLEDPAD